VENMDSYFTRKEIAKQNVTYDRIEKYINYILQDLERHEKVLEKFKDEGRAENDIKGIQYEVDNAKYILGLTMQEPKKYWMEDLGNWLEDF
jgi:hypothetical protein